MLGVPLDMCQLGKGDVRDYDLVVKRLDSFLAQFIIFPDILQGDPCSAAYLGKGLAYILTVLADYGQAVGRLVNGQKTVVPVQNPAPGGIQGKPSLPVVLGLAGKIISIVYL
jgi:hypothetical protein